MDYFHGNSYVYKLCKLTCPGSSLCGSHCLVHTAMTSSQYFLVWPSCSVSKRLIFVNSCDAGVDMKGYIFTILCKRYVFLMLPCAYYSIFGRSCTKKKMFIVSEQSACPVTWEHTRCTSVGCQGVIR